MLKKIIFCLIPLMLSLPLNLHAIDLRCEDLTKNLISRLSSEGLLTAADNAKSRAQAISLSMCAKMQNSAQQQHEESKAAALKNWLFEHKADKPGNKRLKNFKR